MDSRLRGNDGLESVPHAFHLDGETVFPGKTLFCQAFPALSRVPTAAFGVIEARLLLRENGTAAF
jgi:hypothetical protein